MAFFGWSLDMVCSLHYCDIQILHYMKKFFEVEKHQKYLLHVQELNMQLLINEYMLNLFKVIHFYVNSANGEIKLQTIKE